MQEEGRVPADEPAPVALGQGPELWLLVGVVPEQAGQGQEVAAQEQPGRRNSRVFYGSLGKGFFTVMVGYLPSILSKFT